MRAYWCCLKAAGRCEHSSALLLYEIIKFTMKKKNVINQNKVNPPAGPRGCYRLQVIWSHLI